MLHRKSVQCDIEIARLAASDLKESFKIEVLQNTVTAKTSIPDQPLGWLTYLLYDSPASLYYLQHVATVNASQQDLAFI